MVSSNFYSVRLLNPYRGILLIVRVSAGRALSVDGVNWRLQIRTDLKTIPWGLLDPQNIVNAYALYGIWSGQNGLTRFPLNPGIDPAAAGEAAQELLHTLENNLPGIPFPLKDNIEYWLFDKNSLRPLVLVASICQRDERPDTVDKQWLPSPPTDASLNIRINDKEQSGHYRRLSGNDAHQYLASMLSTDFQSGITGRWVERLAGGAGRILLQNNNSISESEIAASSFPEQLLAVEQFPAHQRQVLQDYIQWQSPYLLALQDIDDLTREQWEIVAVKQPLVLHNVYRTYPKIINKKLLNAALVEAVLRKAAEN